MLVGLSSSRLSSSIKEQKSIHSFRCQSGIADVFLGQLVILGLKFLSNDKQMLWIKIETVE